MPLKILLADDDADDRFLFTKALTEISIPTHLHTVHDGEQLMNYLHENSDNLPDITFLDLSMPRKTGFECLTEITESIKLKDLLVVVFTTSLPKNIQFEQSLIKMLSNIGAQEYIRKPGNFKQLKQIILRKLIKLAPKKAA